MTETTFGYRNPFWATAFLTDVSSSELMMASNFLPRSSLFFGAYQITIADLNLHTASVLLHTLGWQVGVLLLGRIEHPDPF